MQISVYREDEVRRKWLTFWTFFGLLIIQSVVIFGFSSHTAEKSAGVSRAIMDKLNWLPEFIPREKSASPSGITLHYIIRKIAHMYNFSLIGGIIYMIKDTLKMSLRKSLIFICYGLLLAVADELYQRFVPGRSGQVSDVCVDFSGVVLGYIFICLFFHIFRRGVSHGRKN